MSESSFPLIVPLNKATPNSVDEGTYYHFIIRNIPMMTRVVLKPGAKTKPHKHEAEEQTYYIISGQGKIYVGDQSYDIYEQTAVLIPPGQPHAIENVGKGDLEWIMQYFWPGEAAMPIYK